MKNQSKIQPISTPNNKTISEEEILRMKHNDYKSELGFEEDDWIPLTEEDLNEEKQED